MTDIKLNTNVHFSTLQQDAQQTAQQDKSKLPPLLARSENLTVSQAAIDLEALLARLSVETADTKEETAKNTLSSAFSVILAKAVESGNASENNMKLLNEMKDCRAQLEQLDGETTQLAGEIQQLEMKIASAENAAGQAKLNADQLDKQLASLQNTQKEAASNMEKLQADVDSLNSIIDERADDANKGRLQKELADAESRLAYAQNTLDNTRKDITATQTQLNQAKTTLTDAQKDLAALKAELAEKTQALKASNAKKEEMGQRINDCINSLTDTDLIRTLADALKIDASAVSPANGGLDVEDDEEKEKKAEAQSPLRIIQDAIAKNSREMLDEIATERKEKV